MQRLSTGPSQTQKYAPAVGRSFTFKKKNNNKTTRKFQPL